MLLWPLEGKEQSLTIHADGSQDAMSLCAGGLCPPSPQRPAVTARVSQGGGALGAGPTVQAAPGSHSHWLCASPGHRRGRAPGSHQPP